MTPGGGSSQTAGGLSEGELAALPGEWDRHFTYRCSNMNVHHGERPLPRPCPACFSIESITRRVAYVPGSERGYAAPGEPVEMVPVAPLVEAAGGDPRALAEALDESADGMQRFADLFDSPPSNGMDALTRDITNQRRAARVLRLLPGGEEATDE